jgi:ParB-like chromosome segregation protein Spo0J
MKTMLISDIVVKSKNNYLNDIPLSDAELNELTESIRKDGIKVPVMVDKKSKILIDGYNRVAVAKKLKMDEIPVDLQDIGEDNIEKVQYELQVGRRNLNASDRKLIIGRLINLQKMSVEHAAKVSGMKKGAVKFAAKVADIVDKSGEKLSVKDAQKLVKVKGRKGAEEEAKKVKESGKAAKEVIKEAVKEKKTKMTPHQILDKPLSNIEAAFDEFPQFEKEFKKILKSFLENL